jgi:NAD(P) transhydrogenase subunit alpha
MTGALMVAIYFIALASFLGLDILSKVPPAMYAVVLAGLGAAAAVSAVGGLSFVGVGIAPQATLFGRVALGLSAASGVAGMVAIARLLSAFKHKRKRG